MLRKSFVCLIVLLKLTVALRNDPCMMMPCAAGQMCVSQGSGTYACFSEADLRAQLRPLSGKHASSSEDTAEELSPEDLIASTRDTDAEDLSASEREEEKRDHHHQRKKSSNLAEDEEKREEAKSRRQLELINIPKNFRREYLDFDPCLSSPCLFGKICHRVEGTSKGFLCLNELDQTKEISEARNIYRNMEILAKEAILLNVETISAKNVNKAKGSSVNLKAKKTTHKNACSTNPCDENESCQLRDDKPDGFVCVKTENSTIHAENDKISQLLNDEKFVESMTEKCRKASQNQRFEIENVPDRFVVCLHDGNSKEHDFTIVNCPDDLVFNKHLDRCDHDNEPLASGCDSSPCQFGSTCVELPDNEYKCECLSGFEGKNCEIAPDVCATDPCGPQGICHSQPSTAPIAYYCTCFNEKAFGLSCDDESLLERNPCDEVDSNELFPTKLDGSVFVHCNMHEFSLKFCANGPVIDKQHIDCKWVDLEETRRKGKNILRSLITKRFVH